MKISTIFRDLKRVIDSNAPVILTGIAVSGACLTTYLAAKGGNKAARAIIAEESKELRLLTAQEKFITTYKFYAPAAAALVGTTACMVMATKIGLDRTAAVAGAFVIAERANDQYRDKVKELLGENKHTKVVNATAEEDAKTLVVPNTIVLDGQDQVFVDKWSGRPFPSTKEKMQKAVNEFNHEMLYGKYASLSEFYNRIGLEDTEESDDIGWNNNRLLELVYTPVLKDDKAVVYFSFDQKPMPGFQKVDDPYCP